MSYTILRTAAGSPVAPSLIGRLKALPSVRVVAADIDPYSSGFEFADASRMVPRVDAEGFVDALIDLCREEGVDLFWPDLDEELLMVSRARERFEEVGTQLMISEPPALEVCRDKLRTYRFFQEHGVDTPASYLPEELAEDPPEGFPLIIKPRSGRGSQDVFKVGNREALDFFLGYVERPIVQEFIEGVEYTVDTLSDLEGNFLYCSVRERMSTDSGISVKGRTLRHARVEAEVKRIVEGMGIVGPACVQGIETEEGRIAFIEVNPRIAGTAILSVAAGAPVATDTVRLARGEAVEGLRHYKEGYVMVRYWQEAFVVAEAHKQADTL